ncbi:hypothetical protein [Geminisphaera colitermitum]|uniref:hypothetical protein n=1 Tax=Geminisphaera colitermitum TaxID=1148786 RepID=UPI0001964E0E|nr:hypothetical protein [Geminisphaera colitermitum]
MKIHSHQGAAIRYQIDVINPDGTLADSRPWRRNLILNRGLEDIASYRWDEVVNYAVAGKGTDPTKRASGEVTFTQNGTTVTASAGFFVAQDAGRLLKLDTGEEMPIEAYTDTTTVTVATARTSAIPTPGTVWYVNQTGLAAEYMRTSTLGTGADDNSVNLLDGKIVLKRTFVFAAVSQQVTIQEVGWSRWNGAGGNLFGRDVLAAGGVTLVSGQQLKIVLELAITVSPLAPENIAFPAWIAGGGKQQLENLNWNHRFHPCNAYNYYIPVFVSDSTDIHKAAHLESGAGSLTGTVKTVEPIRANYIGGSRRYTYRATFTINDGNIAVVRCAGFGWWDYQTFYPIFRIIFDQPQTKDSDHTLTLDFEISWGRVLIN